jgi:hypothetical protein
MMNVTDNMQQPYKIESPLFGGRIRTSSLAEMLQCMLDGLKLSFVIPPNSRITSFEQQAAELFFCESAAHLGGHREVEVARQHPIRSAITKE